MGQNSAGLELASVLRYEGSWWQDYGTALDTYIWGLHLALDGQDSLYSSVQISRSITIRKLHGWDWDTLGLPLNPPRPGDFQTAFSVSGIGKAFCAISVSNQIFFYRFTANSWELLAGQSITSSFPNTLAMANGKNDEPFIFYIDENRKAVVRKFSDGNLQIVGNAAFSDGPVSKAVIAISPTGIPHAAYFESVLGSPKMTIVRLEGTNWVKIGSSISTPEADHINLIVDASGIPYVSYQDGTRSNGITVLRKSFSP